MFLDYERSLYNVAMMDAAEMMASFVTLDAQAGDKKLLGRYIGEHCGYDAILAGYMRMSLICAKILGAKIESCDGVFSYEHLSTRVLNDDADMSLPAVLLREVTVPQWHELIENWRAPGNLEQIIDAWLRDPRVAPGITLKSEPFEAL